MLFWKKNRILFIEQNVDVIASLDWKSKIERSFLYFHSYKKAHILDQLKTDMIKVS